MSTIFANPLILHTSAWKTRKFLDNETGAMLTHAFVTSRLDYCNSLLYGISSSLSAKLQRVLNTAARIITRTRIGNHITPVIKSLHWLPVVQRCTFKTALLIFKVIHGLTPSDLCELIRYRNTSRDLRSINDILLDVPKFKSCLGSRAFVFLLQNYGIICPMMSALVFLLPVLNQNLKHTYFKKLLIKFLAWRRKTPK